MGAAHLKACKASWIEGETAGEAAAGEAEER